VVSYNWTAAGANSANCGAITQSGASPNKATVAVPSGASAISCTYNVSATDSATPTANVAQANKPINYTTGGGGGGGGGGGPITCNNVSNTVTVDMAWGSSSTVQTSGFGPSSALVVRFTTSSITSATGKGYIRGVEYQTPIAPRTGTISDTPCDFNIGLVTVGGGQSAFANDSAPWLYFTLNPTKKSGFASLGNSTTYYFNVINPTGCGGSGSCDMQLFFVKPTGS
jgi:hypothetical protein